MVFCNRCICKFCLVFCVSRLCYVVVISPSFDFAKIIINMQTGKFFVQNTFILTFNKLVSGRSCTLRFFYNVPLSWERSNRSVRKGTFPAHGSAAICRPCRLRLSDLQSGWRMEEGRRMPGGLPAGSECSTVWLVLIGGLCLKRVLKSSCRTAADKDNRQFFVSICLPGRHPADVLSGFLPGRTMGRGSRGRMSVQAFADYRHLT